MVRESTAGWTDGCEIKEGDNNIINVTTNATCFGSSAIYFDVNCKYKNV
jgi:hypothetical protein